VRPAEVTLVDEPAVSRYQKTAVLGRAQDNAICRVQVALAQALLLGLRGSPSAGAVGIGPVFRAFSKASQSEKTDQLTSLDQG
jgi:hypothetical protein